MSNPYLPEWLYKTLPYFYVGAGVLTMVALRGEIAILSGLTLISAGVIVWLMRHRPHPQPLQATRHSSHEDDSKGLVEISWRKSYECGHHAIDKQHRRLFGLSNELIDAVLTKKPKFDIELLLHELVDHIGDHFSTEEVILAENGYNLSAEHKEVHQTLLARAAGLRDGYRNGNVTMQELIGFVTYDIVTTHIVEECKAFGILQEGKTKGDTLQPVERERRESWDTVLKMNREDPVSTEKMHLTVPVLDRLTPAKRLFNQYPHVWQRICVFAPEPRHLQKYLASLTVQDRGEKRAGFSEGALKELGDIYDENQKYLPAPSTVWQSDDRNP